MTSVTPSDWSVSRSPFMGVHAAETHKERIVCEVARNIALERPLGEIGALLRRVAGDVDPRIAACTVFHAA